MQEKQTVLAIAEFFQDIKSLANLKENQEKAALLNEKLETILTEKMIDITINLNEAAILPMIFEVYFDIVLICFAKRLGGLKHYTESPENMNLDLMIGYFVNKLSYLKEKSLINAIHYIIKNPDPNTDEFLLSWSGVVYFLNGAENAIDHGICLLNSREKCKKVDTYSSKHLEVFNTAKSFLHTLFSKNGNVDSIVISAFKNYNVQMDRNIFAAKSIVNFIIYLIF